MVTMDETVWVRQCRQLHIQKPNFVTHNISDPFDSEIEDAVEAPPCQTKQEMIKYYK